MVNLRNTLIAASVAALARAQSTATNCDPTDPTTPPEVCSIRAAFGGNKIPEVVPTFLPSGALYVHYDGIILGGAQQLAPSRVSSAPGIQYNLTQGLDAGPTYVFMMFDPDADVPAVLHYMLTDCTVNQETLYLEGCTAVAPYGGPAPPQGTGLHRYIQLLYTQPSGFTQPNYPATIGSTRLNWDFAGFVSDNNLGNPVGGMYFQSQYDGSSTSATNTRDPNTVGGAAVASTASSSMARSTSASSSARTTSMMSSVSSAARSAASSASASVAPSSGAEKMTVGVMALLTGLVATLF